MKRGTRVGQAYVALHVDGSNVNDDIVNSVEDVDYERLGRNAKGEYEKGWNKTRDSIAGDLEKDAADFEGALKRIHSAVENNRAINQGIAKQLETEFRNGDLDHLFKQLGRDAGVDFAGPFGARMRQAVLDQLQSIRTDAALSGGNADLTNQDGGRTLPNQNYRALVETARKVNEQIDAENKKSADNEQRLRDSNLREAIAAGKRLTAAAQIESAKREKRREQELSRFLDDRRFERFQKLANAQLDKIKIKPKLDEAALAKTRAKIAANLERQDDIKIKLGLDIPEREKAKLRAELAVLTRDVKVHVEEVRRPGLASTVTGGDSEDGIGRFLGAGSRNNFFNLIGRSANNLSNTLEGIARGGAKILSVGKQIGTAFTEGFSAAEGAGGGLFRTMKGIQSAGSAAAAAGSEALAGLISSGPGAVVAVAAVATALSILVSVITALLALVISLAAVIASALVVSLGVAAAALGAVVVAGGLAVAMFTNLSNAQKKVLKADFAPVLGRLRGLAKVLSDPIFSGGSNSPLSVWADNLDKALRGLGPLAHIMGVAFGEAGKIITASLSGKGFQQFFAALSQQTTGLAPIIENLSHALSLFLNGVAGLFATLTPYVFQFSVYLEGLANKFFAFATSADGKTQIKDFFDRGIASLKSFMGFLNAVGGLLNKFLFSAQAQEGGQTIFDKMTKGLSDFYHYLTPERLKTFFDQGVKVADALGHAIHGIGVVLKDLNDAGTIDAIANIAKFGDKAVTAIAKLPGPIKDIIFPLRQIGTVAKAISFAFKAVGTVVLAVIGSMLASIGLLVGALGHLPGKFGAPFRAASKYINGARDDVFTLAEQINALPGDVTIKVKADTRAAAATLNNFIHGLNSVIDKNAAVGGATTFDGLFGVGPGAHPGKITHVAPVKGSVTSGGGSSSGGTNIPNVGPAGYGSGGGGGSSAADKAKEAAAKAKAQAEAIASIYKAIRDGVRAAAKAANAREVFDSINTMIDQMREQSKEFNKAGKQRVAAVARILRAQQHLHKSTVNALIVGKIPKNATLEDFARAREIVTARLQKANEKLAAAISLRDEYRKSVTDAANTFGLLTTAQAKIIDGVEQALTANDITSNLQDRLKKIQDFQANLRILLAQGLSDAAYKQLVDAGVEEGGAFAQALIGGGTGAVQQVNSLTAQINSAANSLGVTASNRMYQAGVDAAKGLVDGLESLSSQLNSAATRLGNSIALAVKRALGIHSPSRVMRDMMGYTGDGLVLGLEDQHDKVGYAAGRLASKIAVSPEVAAYAASQGDSGVSGNKPGFTWTGDFITPTEDPEAVVNEVVNEITGRL